MKIANVFGLMGCVLGVVGGLATHNYWAATWAGIAALWCSLDSLGK